MGDKFRATGRTFRTLLNVMEDGSRGKHVVLVADNLGYSETLVRHMIEMFYAYSSNVASRSSSTFINVAGGGTINVITESKYRKFKDDHSQHIVIDGRHIDRNNIYLEHTVIDKLYEKISHHPV